MKTKMTKLVIAAMLCLATVSMVPAAEAHTCAAYTGCDAKACKDGEDHDHTDYNYVERDEQCKSNKRPPPPPPGSCEYFGIVWPPLVCAVLKQQPIDGEIEAAPRLAE